MQAFILSVPKDTALNQGCVPKLEGPFVLQLSARLRAAAAANRDSELTSVSSFGRWVLLIPSLPPVF